MNDSFNLEMMKTELTRDEGKRNFPYIDTVGKTSIGIGRNLSGCGISDEEIDLMLSNDITLVVAALDTYETWWRDLDAVRQRCMLNMCFNMGIGTFRNFDTFLNYVANGQYDLAIADLKGTKWYSEVGERAIRIASAIATGVMPDA